MRQQFSKNLFWDINLSELNIEKHASYIVGRVLDYGSWDDWILICDYYGMERIRTIALGIRKKKILVTGGAGFIGSNLCEALLELDYSIVCFDNFSTGKIENI
jgi:hypothetical protein